MLSRWPGGGLDLRFERRECVIVPQVPGRVALHADVFFQGSSKRARVISDAHLVWAAPGHVIRRSHWDRAVVAGRFRYPPTALDLALADDPLEVTLTFTDPLIPHGDSPPPPISSLSLELSLKGGRSERRELWRVEMRSWDDPATVEWLGTRP
jgi:hypothetical protein